MTHSDCSDNVALADFVQCSVTVDHVDSFQFLNQKSNRGQKIVTVIKLYSIRQGQM